MGVSTTTNRVLDNGDGSTTTFAFPYYFFGQTDLQVYFYNTTTFAITVAVLSVDYTISGTPNYQGLYTGGANVVCTTAPAVGTVIIIVRAGVLDQLFSLSENGPIPSTTLVQQFDYLTLLVQRLQDQISRVPIVPDGVGVPWSNQLPGTIANQPGQFVCVNSLGNGFTLAGGQWQSTVVGFAALQTAALINSKLILALPPNTLLTGLFAVINTAFVGSSITGLSAGVGLGSDNSYFMTGLDMTTLSNWDGNSDFFFGSLSATTNINLYVTAVGANLSALSAGSITIFFKTETI